MRGCVRSVAATKAGSCADETASDSIGPRHTAGCARSAVAAARVSTYVAHPDAGRLPELTSYRPPAAWSR
jgi:hypothetical protein